MKVNGFIKRLRTIIPIEPCDTPANECETCMNEALRVSDDLGFYEIAAVWGPLTPLLDGPFYEVAYIGRDDNSAIYQVTRYAVA